MIENQQEISKIVLSELIKQNGRKISIIIGILMLFLLTYSFFLPLEFTTSSTIMPSREKSGGGGLSALLQNISSISIDMGNSSGQSKLYQDIIKSRSVCEYVTDSLKLEKNPFFKENSREMIINLIRENVKIQVEKSGITTVSYVIYTKRFPNSDEISNAKLLARDICNKFVEGLDFFLKSKSTSASKRSREYIEVELNKYHFKLDSVSKSLENFQEENKILALDDQAQAVMQQAISVGTELIKSQSDLNLAKIQYNHSSELVKSLEKQIEFLKSQSDKIQMGGLTGTDKFSIPLNQLPKLMREYAELFRNKKIMESVLMYLETQRHQEAIQEEKDIPIIEVLDKAIAPEFKSGPNKKLMFIIGFFVISILTITSYILLFLFKKPEIK